MTDAHSAAAIVKTGAEGAAAWLPLLQTLAGGVLAGGVALYVNHRSHKNALEREEKAASERLRNERQATEEKLARDRYFIGTELVFLLERFAEECIPPACDAGTFDREKGWLRSKTTFPELGYATVTGDWRTLTPRLVYRLRELTVMQEESARLIHQSAKYDDYMEPVETLSIRQYQAARLGIKAWLQASQIRKLCNMPSGVRLHDQKTAAGALWKLWRRHRKAEVGRLVQAKIFREFAEEQQRRDAETYR